MIHKVFDLKTVFKKKAYFASLIQSILTLSPLLFQSKGRTW